MTFQLNDDLLLIVETKDNDLINPLEFNHTDTEDIKILLLNTLMKTMKRTTIIMMIITVAMVNITLEASVEVSMPFLSIFFSFSCNSVQVSL